jgi:hypothetical protein
LYTDYILRVAAETIKNGGSASKLNEKDFLPPRDVWSFPKYPARTMILPPTVDLAVELREFITRNEALLNETDCWLGTWINPRTKEYYLDIATGIVDLNEARRAAIRISHKDGRKIVAIFNSKRNETVYLWDSE